MIYTVTCNPALDYTVRVSTFRAGMTNRSEGEQITVGGKGINVSLMLAELGVASTAMGFLAGFTGDEIERGLHNGGIIPDFVRLPSGFSRINIKLRGFTESEINAVGPDIGEEALARFFEKIKKIESGDTLVLAGHIPASLPRNTYSEILRIAADKQVQTVVDTSGALLADSLVFCPFLIKPNRQELSELFGVEIHGFAEAETYARKLRQAGAQNVLVSLGGDGALLVDETDAVHIVGTVAGKVIGTVGAGDSMVAGFLAGYAKTRQYSYAFQLAAACGMATAFSDWIGKKEMVDRCLAALNEENTQKGL